MKKTLEALFLFLLITTAASAQSIIINTPKGGGSSATPSVFLSDIRVGADTGTTGYDVNFYGAAAGSYNDTRMFWDSSKAAFRSGRGVGNWVDAKVGRWSFAAGVGDTASGESSVSLGETNDCRGDDSFCTGYSNINYSGQASTNMGQYNRTTGNFSTAIGFDISVTGQSAMAIGAGVGAYNFLTNVTPNSLMIGFNSTIPTFSVLTSAGVGTVGAVQIGCQTTAPSACAAAGDAGKEACSIAAGTTSAVKCFCTGTAWVAEAPALGVCW